MQTKEFILAPSTLTEDKELSISIQSGSPEAMEAFYTRFLPLARHLGEIALLEDPAVDIDDLVQEAMEYMFVVAKTREPNSKMSLNTEFIYRLKKQSADTNPEDIEIQSLDSIQQTLESCDDAEIPNSLDNLVQESPEDTVVADYLKDHLNILVNDLNERYADIIKKLYGLDGETVMSEAEVADMYGVSKLRISQIKKTALGQIRQSQKFIKIANYRYTE